MNPDQEAAALAVAHAFMIQNGITPPPIPAQEPQSSAPEPTQTAQSGAIFAEDPVPEPEAAQQPAGFMPPGPMRPVSMDDFVLRAAENGNTDLSGLFKALGSTPSRGAIAPTPHPALPPRTIPAPYPTHTLSTPAGVGVMEQLLTEIGGLRASIDKLCMILGAK